MTPVLTSVCLHCRIADFLGYAPSELEGQSAYEYHHVIDNEMILKSYKTSTSVCSASLGSCAKLRTFFLHSVHQGPDADAAVPVFGEERRLRVGPNAGHARVRFARFQAAGDRMRAQLLEASTYIFV